MIPFTPDLEATGIRQCQRTRLLLGAAIVVSGILAGTVFDRVVVGGPAWHSLGAEAWAQYSRQADLGTGLVVYPVSAAWALSYLPDSNESGPNSGRN